MRVFLLGALAATLVACGELRGATEFTDAFFEPVDSGASQKDSAARAPNSLSGDYYHDLIPETRGAFRLDRRTAPNRPWIVFVSTESSSQALTCASFASVDWNKTAPASAIIHIIELGTNAAGDYTVEKASPPGALFATVGRTQQSGTELKLELATKGFVNIVRWDARSVSGAFEAEFPTFLPEDDVDAGPIAQIVRGSFDVTACAVDW